MNDITVIHNPTKEYLTRQGALDWPIWEKEVSEFPWHYDEQEQCYILEGDVEVTPKGGTPVRFGAGNFVTFPAGMSCTWKISRAVRKHYRFG